MAPSEIYDQVDRWGDTLDSEAEESHRSDQSLGYQKTTHSTDSHDDDDEKGNRSDVMEDSNDEKRAEEDYLPEYLKKLREAENIPADFDVSQDIKPSWYDEAKFKRGQKFVGENFFCVNFAGTLAVLLSFAVKPSVIPFIFTNKTTAPFSASQRYLSTGLRLKSWFTQDPFDKNSEGYKNIATVKNLHRSVRDRLSKASAEEIKKCCSITGDKSRAIWSDAESIEMLQKDFGTSCPNLPRNGRLSSNLGSREWCSQADLVDAQFGFVGLSMTFSKQFGMHYATDEELDDFVHMWRVLGYLMGIKDEYNFCSEGIEGVRIRTHNYLEYVYKPALREVDETWEHMARCFIAGIGFYSGGVHFESLLKHVCHVIDTPIPKFSKRFSFVHSFFYYFVRFTFDIALRFMPSLATRYNNYALWRINVAATASPETLDKWKNTEFPYMKKSIVEN